VVVVVFVVVFVVLCFLSWEYGFGNRFVEVGWRGSDLGLVLIARC
jgi:hypothetical protein